MNCPFCSGSFLTIWEVYKSNMEVSAFIHMARCVDCLTSLLIVNDEPGLFGAKVIGWNGGSSVAEQLDREMKEKYENDKRLSVE